MHRRARHLTGRAADANLYLDSRFISGLSDGTGVDTWNDLSSKANNATQSTSGKRPLYKTNIRGGCPMLLFDGSDDMLSCSATTYGSGSTIIAMIKANTTSGAGTIIYIGNFNNYTPNYNWIGLNFYSNGWASGNYSDPNNGDVKYSPNDTNYNVLTGIVNDSGTNRIFLNGTAGNTASSQTININSAVQPAIGGIPSDPLNGYIGIIGYWPLAFSASMRRRFEQAMGFSYKIACS
jgi:hypothetical protein